MLKFKIFIFIYLYIFALEEFEEDLIEGTKSYTFEKETYYNFTFKAIDNGTYVIIFPGFFKLLEATGEINEDVDFNYGFLSNIYAQNFTKGDYIKVEYPRLSIINETITKKIKIEKIDAYFKLMTSVNPVIFTMAVNDCQKPTYIFTYNSQPELPESYYTFNGKIHSGDFIGSYRISELNPDDPIDKDFSNFDISSATTLPYNISLNIVKLQCKIPGIISIYMEKGNFYTILDDISFTVVNNEYVEEVSFPNYKFPVNLYFQGFNLVGKTSIDFSKINGKSFEKDFYTKISLSSEFSQNFYNISIKNNDLPTMILTNLNVGESKDILLEENKNITVQKYKRAIIKIDSNSKKKYIAIKSNNNKFYWDYQYSQTSDINYLPKLSYDSKHFQNGNIVFIDNPYTYSDKKTFYNWFVSLLHLNEGESKFTYKYTNEKIYIDEDEDEDDVDKDDDDNDGSSKVWIIVIVIIAIIIIAFVAFYFIKKRKKETNSNIETLVNTI